MNITVTSKLIFGILLSLGTIVLLILSFKLFYKYMIQEKRCTAKIMGTIKRYTLMTYGSGVHLPVVFYVVNGKEYKVVGPEYSVYITMEKSSPFSKNEMEYKTRNQTLKVNRSSNSFVGAYRNPIEQLYPLNSEIEVYYDPKNPKLAYVLRYCNMKWAFYLTFGAALLTLALCLFLILY